ncbi:MAG: prepilin peptidase [Candidatus Eisenbacteria bacterium]|uniref:Prepilin leader peptidase/N-methyltransferase n=1 Tax=Eiseniibacteriota bacterium TaxID=2212470 RepID=A0A937XBF9_UNCEI|nr:prepilin peptidase [Candidatus Eisenbacteria bacterium]
MPDWLAGVPGLPAALGVLGLILGSFLNVVIQRLPRDESLWRPRSRCPRCRRALAAGDNLPLASYLILRGRCRHCRAPIPLRYPIVEMLGALALPAAALASASPVAAAVRGAFLLALIAVAFIDLEHQIIPDEISLPGLAAGLLAAPLIGVPRGEAAIGAVAGAGGLLLVALGYRLVRRREGMGMGDVKLAAMLGAFLGWRGLVVSVLGGSLLGSACGLVLLARGRASGRTPLPFGTFLAAAAAAVALAGPAIHARLETLLIGPR